jgi:putative SOS response-associated peptidase YedK
LSRVNLVLSGSCAAERAFPSDYSEIRIAFRIPPDWPAPNLRPNWNLAPTQDIAIVRRDAEGGDRRLDVVRWGLLPFWAKDEKLSY